MLSKCIRYQAKESFKHNWRRILRHGPKIHFLLILLHFFLFFSPPDAGRGGVWVAVVPREGEGEKLPHNLRCLAVHLFASIILQWHIPNLPVPVSFFFLSFFLFVFLFLVIDRLTYQCFLCQPWRQGKYHRLTSYLKYYSFSICNGLHKYCCDLEWYMFL